MDFETMMGELEDIVMKLESGRITLEESLALFEKGSKLTFECQRLLEQAESKIKVLTEGTYGGLEETEVDYKRFERSGR